ncbi:PREDICTED: cadherin-related family member 4 isoform X1 [Gavialis gangeticus]|uniref:cadherin-related family member 4 isoform X1 n=2 Tax=Gavialis gangeticus TaxID=94835 RepID=UPI00092F87A2|nr:PREDICTED: cadherin-related family member 4 isoform X1 [Gavialis gangeticus]
MGVFRHLPLLLLLILGTSGVFIRATAPPYPALLDLPRTVNVSENAPPGMSIAEFILNCTHLNSNISVTLQSVTPPTAFFNPPAISPSDTVDKGYSIKITLSPAAALDARQVNQYTLVLQAQCPAEELVETQLFVQVRPEDAAPQCMGKFASADGDLVEVPENVAPLLPIYTVILQRLVCGLRFTIEDNNSPFSISSSGQVLAPETGFSLRHHNQFRLQILVTDRRGRNCSGILKVQVLHVHQPRVNFTVPWQAVMVQENTGPMQRITEVSASGDNVRYKIIAPAFHRLYTINSRTGEIRNTYNVDLGQFPEAAYTQLLVQAYDMLHPSDSATMMLNITVLKANVLAPRCSPAVFVAQLPETTPIDRTLMTLTCMDPDVSNSSLHYQVEGDQKSRYIFRMKGHQLQVNATLDYDSESIAAAGFQYVATILVTDSRQPSQTTSVSVLVTVTPVNEYPPACPVHSTFSVREDAAFGYVIGFVNGTDWDYPFNSIIYSLIGGAGGSLPAFYIGPRSGRICVLRPLDYERQTTYHLTVKLQDVHNDVDPTFQRSVSCSITINVQDVNDQPPVCQPMIKELSIYSTLAPSQPVTYLECSDYDRSTVLPLCYTIVGGNINGRFHLRGNTLYHNHFSYDPDGIVDPLTFELLVEVLDSCSPPHHSTTATVIVHVIPWATTVPTTSTLLTTPRKEPLVITRTDYFWEPTPWFMVVLTISGILLLAALGWLAWGLLCWSIRREPTQLLLQDRSLPHTASVKREKGDLHDLSKEMDSSSILSLGQFDGRAQDPLTGREYLFNSSTGARRWT